MPPFNVMELHTSDAIYVEQLQQAMTEGTTQGLSLCSLYLFKLTLGVEVVVRGAYQEKS